MSGPAANSHSRVRFALKVIAVCALLPLALAPFLYAAKVIRFYPYSIDREEAFLLQQAVELTKGNSIYHDISTEPYTVGNYPPVYPWVFSLLLRIGADGLAAGRAIVMVAAAGIALCIAGIVFRQTRNWFAAAVAPLLFLATYEVQYWIPFARVDIPALFFTTLGLLLFVWSDKKWALISSAIVFTVAAFTKQTEVIAPIACVAALLISRRFRDALAFGGIFAGLCVVIFLILNAATDGEFWKHTVIYNQNTMKWSLAFPLWRHILRLYGVQIALVIVLVLFNFRRLLETRERATTILFGALSLLSLVSISKVGSDVNYLLTPEIALAMLVGTLLPACHSPGESRRWPAIACCVLLAAHIAHTWRPGIQMIIRKQPPDAMSRNNADAVLLAVNETKGEVLGEDAIFPILDHRPVVYQPFIMTQLSKEGKWNQDAFVQDLRRGRFTLILTMNCLGPDCVVPGFTQEMRSAILERYELQGVVPLYPNQHRFFYTPKPITSESP